ncbi:MAG: LEA type 2 family protein [Bacteroidales bacterium]|nr:LEA type 2 family protein [Bacteroidales bacterium]
MKKQILAISFFVFLFFVSCSTFEEVRIGPATGIEINGFSGKQVNFKVMVNIENPNRQSFTLRILELDVSLNGTYIGQIKSTEKVNIPKRSGKVYTFPLSAELESSSFNVLALTDLFLHRYINVELKGIAKINSGLMRKKIPVNEQEKIKLY